MAAHLGTHLSATTAAFGESDLLAAVVCGGEGSPAAGGGEIFYLVLVSPPAPASAAPPAAPSSPPTPPAPVAPPLDLLLTS